MLGRCVYQYDMRITIIITFHLKIAVIFHTSNYIANAFIYMDSRKTKGNSSGGLLCKGDGTAERAHSPSKRFLFEILHFIIISIVLGTYLNSHQYHHRKQMKLLLSFKSFSNCVFQMWKWKKKKMGKTMVEYLLLCSKWCELSGSHLSPLKKE